MFADYEKFTNVSFTAGDQKRGEDAYYEDLTERGKKGGSGRGSRNIDLIIVADQMLTGWDDKYLNILYNDRMLELQGLIQAYSRTNRVLGSRKEFGTIINYMRPKESERAVNEALSLYGSGGENSLAYVDTYKVAVEKLRGRVEKMRAVLIEPTEWKKLEHDEEGKKAFIKAFKSASSQKLKVEQYYEFVWADDSFGITAWKKEKYLAEVWQFAAKWGADAFTLQASVDAYDETTPETIPRIDELQESLNYDIAEEKHGEMFFDHWMDFTEELPGWIREERRDYWA